MQRLGCNWALEDGSQGDLGYMEGLYRHWDRSEEVLQPKILNPKSEKDRSLHRLHVGRFFGSSLFILNFQLLADMCVVGVDGFGNRRDYGPVIKENSP